MASTAALAVVVILAFSFGPSTVAGREAGTFVAFDKLDYDGTQREYEVQPNTCVTLDHAAMSGNWQGACLHLFTSRHCDGSPAQKLGSDQGTHSWDVTDSSGTPVLSIRACD